MQSEKPSSVSKLSLSRQRASKRQREIRSPIVNNIIESQGRSLREVISIQEEQTPVSKKIKGYNDGSTPAKINNPHGSDSDNEATNLLTQEENHEADNSDSEVITEIIPKRSPFGDLPYKIKSLFFSRWSDSATASKTNDMMNERNAQDDLITPKRSGSRIPFFSTLSPLLSQSPLFRTPKTLQVLHKSKDYEDEDFEGANDSDSEVYPVKIKSQTPYLDKVERNKKRNEDKLKELGFLPQNGFPNHSLPSPEDHTEEAYIVKDEVDGRKIGCTGMIFPTSFNKSFYNAKQTFSSVPLENIYPHRSKQITLLRALCASSIRQIDFANDFHSIDVAEDDVGLEAYVPTPIFVTGPNSTGKTSVVLDVLAELKNDRFRQSKELPDTRTSVAIAYIDCSVAELHKSGASGILESAYHQIYSQLKKSVRYSKRINKSAKQKSDLDTESMTESCFNESSIDLDHHSIDDDDIDEDASKSSDVETNKYNDSNVDDDDEEEWIRKEASKYMLNHDTTKKPDIKKARSNRRRSSRLGDMVIQEETSENKSVNHLSSIKMKNKRLTGQLNTPMAFGRSIKQFCAATQYNKFQRGCAFLVLDRAETLLSLSSTSINERTNLLSQLLLLPRTLSLNLSIIVITDKAFLENTRINNVLRPNNVTGTISEAIVPFRVHFDAYRGIQEFRDILTTPHMRKLVVRGNFEEEKDSIESLLIHNLYTSMVEILVQSVEGITRDVGEIARLSRIAWPIFIDPLYQKADVKDIFLNHITDDNPVLKGEILQNLGQYFRPHVKRLISQCLLQPGQVISVCTPESLQFSASLPYLAKFLLLAAYLCQHNTPDKDATLFTSQRKGRRKKLNSTQNDSISHASNQSTRKLILSERLSSFPLERMLSIFSSICNKYASAMDADIIKSITGKEVSLGSEKLGSLSVFKSICDLKAMGLLEEVGLNSAFDDNMIYTRGVTSTKYVCNLSRTQAECISNELEFPLLEHLTTS